jgi:hypothetical protein
MDNDGEVVIFLVLKAGFSHSHDDDNRGGGDT